MNSPHKFPFSAGSASFLEHPSLLSGMPCLKCSGGIRSGCSSSGALSALSHAPGRWAEARSRESQGSRAGS